MAWPPLNLQYIAVMRPSHYKIAVTDENIRPFAYREADIVGITAYTSTAPRDYEIAKIYREKNISVVMGGIHASMLPDEAADYCDEVVTGEAGGSGASFCMILKPAPCENVMTADWPTSVIYPCPDGMFN